MLINVSRQMGFDRSDPHLSILRQLAFMPKKPFEITEADFRLGRAYRTRGSGNLHLEVWATKRLVDYAKAQAEAGRNKDPMVLPMAIGNVPIFYADRLRAEPPTRGREPDRSQSEFTTRGHDSSLRPRRPGTSPSRPGS